MSKLDSDTGNFSRGVQRSSGVERVNVIYHGLFQELISMLQCHRHALFFTVPPLARPTRGSAPAAFSSHLGDLWDGHGAAGMG